MGHGHTAGGHRRWGRHGRGPGPRSGAARATGHAAGTGRADLGHHRPPPRAAALGRPLRRQRPGVGGRVHHREPHPAPDRPGLLRGEPPGSFEENGGLFVALSDEDMDYRPGFLAGCAACGIPTRELTPAQALALEPGLTPALKAAVWVPDATMDAMRLPLRFFATAQQSGARLRPFTEVTSLLHAGRRVSGVAIRDHLTGREAELGADLVVNATGPWCERLAAMAGAAVPVQPSPGVLLALSGRLCNLVVNRLHPAGDGDIVVPQRALSIVGTSAWTVTDPDDLDVPEDHIERMFAEGSKMIPAVRH